MLDAKEFKKVIKLTPLVSIDFIVTNGKKVLLGKRKNNPAKGSYFSVGGRIFKNESIKQAQKRILSEELNIKKMPKLKFLGIYEHFYKNSFFNDDVSTHYVNLAYKIKNVQIKNLPTSQHVKYKYFKIKNINKNKKIHKNVKEYFRREK